MTEPVLQEDRLDYTPTARSIPLARRRVARLVREWGRPEAAGDAALLVSELATNALLHGSVQGRLFRVHLTLTAATLRIAVTDARGERLPEARAAADDEKFGRGLVIVSMLAARWDVAQLTVGKEVWCELDLKPTAA
ncbi:ATP-binding protein [Streptomyces spiroverticillatus]|uniref:ATP-binding protein n=1 Tax=Streptomyces finlayi TaxID=67296 RepID=UPI0027E4CCEA|nr:ATP-binding protein [Streptomyces finlayi]